MKPRPRCRPAAGLCKCGPAEMNIAAIVMSSTITSMPARDGDDVGAIVACRDASLQDQTPTHKGARVVAPPTRTSRAGESHAGCCAAGRVVSGCALGGASWCEKSACARTPMFASQARVQVEGLPSGNDAQHSEHGARDADPMRAHLVEEDNSMRATEAAAALQRASAPPSSAPAREAEQRSAQRHDVLEATESSDEWAATWSRAGSGATPPRPIASALPPDVAGWAPAGQAPSSANFTPFSIATAIAVLVLAAARFGRHAAESARLDPRRLESVVEARRRRAASEAQARERQLEVARSQSRVRAATAQVRSSCSDSTRPLNCCVRPRVLTARLSRRHRHCRRARLRGAESVQAADTAAEAQRKRAAHAAAMTREAERARLEREAARKDYETAEARQAEELEARRAVEARLLRERAAAREAQEAEARRIREVGTQLGSVYICHTLMYDVRCSMNVRELQGMRASAVARLAGALPCRRTSDGQQNGPKPSAPLQSERRPPPRRQPPQSGSGSPRLAYRLLQKLPGALWWKRHLPGA